MKITPLDLTQKTFGRVLRGLDPREVEPVLALAASELEAAALELNGLRDTLQKKEAELAELRGRERTLQDTLVTAQKACEGIRKAALDEAELTRAKAALEGEKIVQSAHERYLRELDDLAELRRQRVQFEAGLRAMVEAQLELMTSFAAPPSADAQGRQGAKAAPAARS